MSPTVLVERDGTPRAPGPESARGAERDRQHARRGARRGVRRRWRTTTVWAVILRGAGERAFCAGRRPEGAPRLHARALGGTARAVARHVRDAARRAAADDRRGARLRAGRRHRAGHAGGLRRRLGGCGVRLDRSQPGHHPGRRRHAESAAHDRPQSGQGADLLGAPHPGRRGARSSGLVNHVVPRAELLPKATAAGRGDHEEQPVRRAPGEVGDRSAAPTCRSRTASSASTRPICARSRPKIAAKASPRSTKSGRLAFRVAEPRRAGGNRRRASPAGRSPGRPGSRPRRVANLKPWPEKPARVRRRSGDAGCCVDRRKCSSGVLVYRHTRLRRRLPARSGTQRSRKLRSGGSSAADT